MQLRHAVTLSRSLAELAILRTAQLEGGRYVFDAHVPHALAAGIDPKKIAALDLWADTCEFDPTERAVLTFVDALAERREIAESVRTGLRDHLSERQMVELTATIGFYIAAARMACGFALNGVARKPVSLAGS